MSFTWEAVSSIWETNKIQPNHSIYTSPTFHNSITPPLSQPFEKPFLLSEASISAPSSYTTFGYGSTSFSVSFITIPITTPNQTKAAKGERFSPTHSPRIPRSIICSTFWIPLEDIKTHQQALHHMPQRLPLPWCSVPIPVAYQPIGSSPPALLHHIYRSAPLYPAAIHDMNSIPDSGGNSVQCIQRRNRRIHLTPRVAREHDAVNE